MSKVLTKLEWREYFRTKLHKLTVDETYSKSVSISKHTEKFLKNQSGVWAGFRSLSSEPEINWQEIAPQVNWVYPKSEGDVLAFYSASKFTKGRFGISEPEGGTLCSLNDIKGVFIPGLGFDRKGVRLGKGKGFFDKSLSKYKGTTVGVCFALQIADQNLPTEDHDIKMDFIISDEEVICIKNKR